jgi:hypothetical protein
MITVKKETIYNRHWESMTGMVHYTYYDSVNNKTRKSFICDRICYHFERTHKRINPNNSDKINIEPYLVVWEF